MERGNAMAVHINGIAPNINAASAMNAYKAKRAANPIRNRTLCQRIEKAHPKTHKIG